MSKTRTFEVTLTPLEPYFFGGEKTFFKDPNKPSESQEYYVRSNLYPQQTALLGAIRYTLLEQNGLLPIQNYKTEAERLIGPQSFDMCGGTEQCFGVIGEMSPLFFKDANGWWRVTEKSKGFNLQTQTGSLNATLSDPIPKETLLLGGYKAKEGIKRTWIDANGNVVDNDNVPDNSAIFSETVRVGIHKEKGKDNEEAFFKQVYIQLKNQYRFVFRILLKENENFVFERPENNQKQIQFFDTVISMGGERSPFRMEVISKGDLYYHNLVPVHDHTDAPKLVLLSDAVVEMSDLNCCRFVLADIVDFRQFRTSVANTKSYTNRLGSLEKNKGAMHIAERSHKFNLLEKGGVLYFNNNERLEAFAKKLEAHPAYKIGYNHFQKIQTN